MTSYLQNLEVGKSCFACTGTGVGERVCVQELDMGTKFLAFFVNSYDIITLFKLGLPL